MRPLFGIPFLFLFALSLTACSEEKAPPPPDKPLPVAAVRATVDGEPVAPNQLLAAGKRVIVRGEESTGEGTLIFHWTLHAPPQSDAVLLVEGENRNAFDVDVGGTYRVELVVEDKNGQSEPAFVEVRGIYDAPTAVLKLNAPDPTVALEHEVVADGSESHDPSGLPLTYNFRLTRRPSGSKAQLQSDGAQATFAPDVGGEYEVGLQVRNETTQSTEVTRTIEVAPPHNRPPVAHAGSDSGNHRLGVPVTLDASRTTDPDGDELSYLWSFVSVPEGSEAVIEQADEKIASFIPDLEGAYVIELEVSDGEYSDTAQVTKGAKDIPNLPPSITSVRIDGNTAPELTDRLLGEVVTIEAQVFDEVPGTEVTLDWVLDKPAGSEADFEDLGPYKKNLEADVAGTYKITLTANDGELDSPPLTFEIRFRSENLPPVAVIEVKSGEPGQVEFQNNTLINLDGSGSYDTDNPPDSVEFYEWNLNIRPPGAPTYFAEGPQHTQMEYRLTRKGRFVFQLRVKDAPTLPGITELMSEPATVEITSTNRPPVAFGNTVGGTKIASLANVHLSLLEEVGSSSAIVVTAEPQSGVSHDPDVEDGITYKWEIIQSPPGSNPCLRVGDLLADPPGYCEAVVPRADKPSEVKAAAFFTDAIGEYEVMLTITDTDPDDPLTDFVIISFEII